VKKCYLLRKDCITCVICCLYSIFAVHFFFCYDLLFCLDSEYFACLYHLCPMWERHVVIGIQSLTVIRVKRSKQCGIVCNQGHSQKKSTTATHWLRQCPQLNYLPWNLVFYFSCQKRNNRNKKKDWVKCLCLSLNVYLLFMRSVFHIAQYKMHDEW